MLKEANDSESDDEDDVENRWASVEFWWTASLQD